MRHCVVPKTAGVSKLGILFSSSTIQEGLSEPDHFGLFWRLNPSCVANELNS